MRSSKVIASNEQTMLIGIHQQGSEKNQRRKTIFDTGLKDQGFEALAQMQAASAVTNGDKRFKQKKSVLESEVVDFDF